MNLQVAFAQAGERAIVTSKLLSRVLPQVNVQVGFNGTGIAAEGAFVRLLIGVDPQVGLKRVFKFEKFVAVFTGKYF